MFYRLKDRLKLWKFNQHAKAIVKTPPKPNLFTLWATVALQQSTYANTVANTIVSLNCKA